MGAIGDPRLSDLDFKILALLCSQDPDATGHPIPMFRQNLVDIAHCNRYSATRSLTRLCECKWLARHSVGRKGKPSKYSINWENPPILGSSCATLFNELGSSTDTLSDELGSSTATQKELGSSPATEPDGSGSSTDTLSDGLGSSTATISGLGSSTVTHDQDHDDDDIYTNQDHHQEGDLTTQAVHDLLASHRINSISSAHARTLINSWIERGVTYALLEKAIQRSLTHCKTGVPGVPYIDRAIGSLLDEATGKPAAREQEFHDTPDEEIPWLNEG